MSYSGLLEDLIHDVGGCGRFQWLTALVGQLGKAITAFSMLAMTFNGQQPSFYCKSQNDDINMSEMVPAYGKDCSPNNVTECGGYVFEDSMNTVVNEVCIL